MITLNPIDFNYQNLVRKATMRIKVFDRKGKIKKDKKLQELLSKSKIIIKSL
jgi:hypothetical protein